MFVFVSGEGTLNDIWLLEGDVSEADKTASAGGCGSADFNLIALHGIFMFLGWGILLQAGAFIARYFRHIDPAGWWFKMHRIFQVSRIINTLAFSTVTFVCLGFGHFIRSFERLGLYE